MVATQKNTILIIDDTVSLSRMYAEYLKQFDLPIIMKETGQAGLAYIREENPILVLLDLNLPDIPGLDILKTLHQENIQTAFIVISAYGSIQRAVDAMRYGAIDFLSKPFPPERLLVTVKNTLEHVKLKRLVTSYQTTEHKDHFYGFIGQSLPMHVVYRTIDSVAGSRASVFITGESGTGKEVCAEAIHKHSPRRDKPFVALNCAAIPKELIESEIFGHCKGAFTGAVSDRIGAAQQADGGTLFLDEICEMDIDLQAKLLRFIQTSEFQRVGGHHTEKVDVRFVCATNKDPLQMVKEKKLREDLYYRLYVVPIEMPPLKERGHDIILLAQAFLKRFAADEGKNFKDFDDDVKQIFLHYNWPGNVRELQNIVQQMVVLSVDDTLLTVQKLPLSLFKEGSIRSQELFHQECEYNNLPNVTSSFLQDEQILPLWQIEREAIEKAIQLCNGSIPEAAERLEVSPSTIYRKKMQWDEK